MTGSHGTVDDDRGSADTISLDFLGGAASVTGSRFLLSRADRRVLVDCGLYQGERELRRRNWQPFPVAPSALDDVVLTHCHLDHCGYLPALVRDGFAGPVWATEGTAALAEIVLKDSGYLNERDAAQAREGGWSRHQVPLPLYTAEDAARAARLLRPVEFGRPVDLGGGVHITASRAGHVLGSASILVEAGGTSVLFSGDLGRTVHPVLRPRADPPAATTVVIESTYGDREHPEPEGPPHEAFAAAVRRTVQRGGSVLVPAFAVDRTELVLQALSEMVAAGRIPHVPVHVDSPMALEALAIYRRESQRGEMRPGVDPELAHLPLLRAARTPDESKALNYPAMPCIIVSASGMGTGGRVVHHLRHMLPDPRNTVVLTGYQAVGTRGRTLADGAAEVKIHGRYVPVAAEIVRDEEFSVHADASELIDWLRALPRRPEVVYVVHGEESASRAFAARVRAELGLTAVVPALDERVRLA